MAETQLLHVASERQKCQKGTRAQADGSILEASKRAVEEAIWNNIHGQRFYLAEQAPICKGRLQGEFGYLAKSPESEQVLDGTYCQWDGVNDGTQDLFAEIAKLRRIIRPNLVDTTLTRQCWRDRWQAAK